MSTKPLNRAERVFRFLEEREGSWIEATRFERIGGQCGWRTALSECRRGIAARQGYELVNRQRRQRIGKRTWTLSEYALVKRSKQGRGQKAA